MVVVVVNSDSGGGGGDLPGDDEHLLSWPCGGGNGG